MNKSAYIITFTPYFKNILKAELTDLDKSVYFDKDISDSIALINSKKSFSKVFDLYKKNTPIFVKHIMPVMRTGKITGTLESDRDILLNGIREIVEMAKGSKFSVQCRIVDANLSYSSKDLEVYIGNMYFNEGYIPSFSDKEILNEDIFVISVLINKFDYYIGFSKSSDNLNFQSDEHRICSRTGREISRAENKLKEALAVFKIELRKDGSALDLGASPGGWTKVLVDYGYKVTSVDPGMLDISLQDNPNITHLKCKIEDLKFKESFDLIVNDMNIDPQITGDIMNSLSEALKEKGYAIVTLKLPIRPRESVKEATKILNMKYDVLKIRSLFHNRQEVTALLRKK